MSTNSHIEKDAQLLGECLLDYRLNDELGVESRLSNLEIDESGFFRLKSNNGQLDELSNFLYLLNNLLPSDWLSTEEEELSTRLIMGGREVSGTNNRRVKGVDSNTLEYIYKSIPRKELALMAAINS